MMFNNSVRIFNIEINSCPASSQYIGGRLIIIFTLILTQHPTSTTPTMAPGHTVTLQLR